MRQGKFSLSQMVKSIHWMRSYSRCAKAWGGGLPESAFPLSPLRTAAEVMDKGARIVGLRPFGFRSALDKYTEDLAVDGHKIQDEIEFRPEYDLFSGWKETIEEMRRRGEL